MTLMLSLMLMLMAAWLRSLLLEDCVVEIGRQGAYNVESSRGAVHLSQLCSERYALDSYYLEKRRARWYSGPSRVVSVPGYLQPHGVQWYLKWCGFESREEFRPQWIGTSYRYRVWAVPYWSLVIPVTLLSAYLILVPSRKQPTTTSQTHA